MWGSAVIFRSRKWSASKKVTEVLPCTKLMWRSTGQAVVTSIWGRNLIHPQLKHYSHVAALNMDFVVSLRTAAFWMASANARHLEIPVFSDEMVWLCRKTVCILKGIVCKKKTSILVRTSFVRIPNDYEHDVKYPPFTQLLQDHSRWSVIAKAWAQSMSISKTWYV